MVKQMWLVDINVGTGKGVLLMSNGVVLVWLMQVCTASEE